MADLDPFAGLNLLDLRVDVEYAGGAKVTVTHIPSAIVARSNVHASGWVAKREAGRRLAGNLAEAYGACTYDAWGADFGVQAGAACVNLNAAHQRVLHGKPQLPTIGG